MCATSPQEAARCTPLGKPSILCDVDQIDLSRSANVSYALSFIEYLEHTPRVQPCAYK
jgi:hypothetical protein